MRNNPIDSVPVNLSWIEPLGESPITGYSIVITPPLAIIADYPSECRGSINPCNINISSEVSNVASLQFRFSLSTSYNISVSAMNCDSQLGEPSVFGVNLKGDFHKFIYTGKLNYNGFHSEICFSVPTGDVVKETIFLEYNNQVLKNVFLSWRPVVRKIHIIS